MHVHEMYNNIAFEFSQTRNRSWEDFEVFQYVIQSQESILDIGCGNGRLIDWVAKNGKGIKYLGIDASQGMIERAKKSHPDNNFLVGDMSALPLEAGSFDAVFAIASLNHLLTREDQKQAIDEMYRVLKKGGYLCMTNWNLWRLTMHEKSWWHYIPRVLLSANWNIVPTRWNGHLLPYYAFTLRELRLLVKQAGFKIEAAYYSKKGEQAHWWNGRNLVLIARK